MLKHMFGMTTINKEIHKTKSSKVFFANCYLLVEFGLAFTCLTGSLLWSSHMFEGIVIKWWLYRIIMQSWNQIFGQPHKIIWHRMYGYQFKSVGYMVQILNTKLSSLFSNRFLYLIIEHLTLPDSEQHLISFLVRYSLISPQSHMRYIISVF